MPEAASVQKEKKTKVQLTSSRFIDFIHENHEVRPPLIFFLMPGPLYFILIDVLLTSSIRKKFQFIPCLIISIPLRKLLSEKKIYILQ